MTFNACEISDLPKGYEEQDQISKHLKKIKLLFNSNAPFFILIFAHITFSQTYPTLSFVANFCLHSIVRMGWTTQFSSYSIHFYRQQYLALPGLFYRLG